VETLPDVFTSIIKNIHVTISIFGGGGAGRVRYIITINGNILFMVADMSAVLPMVKLVINRKFSVQLQIK
jgi:hypothetical protein